MNPRRICDPRPEVIAIHRITGREFARVLYPKHVRRGVLTLLHLAAPEYVSLPAIVDWIYGGLEDGGPDFPDQCIRHAIWTLRQSGIDIDCRFGFGYRLEAA